MSAPSNDDVRLTALWFWIQILGACATSLLLTVRVICGRIIPAKSLRGNNVVITNGKALLCQELRRQLTSLHHCNVVVIDESDKYKCDLLNNESVKQLARRMQEDFRHIDVVIDTGIMTTPNEHQPTAEFVQRTSNGIMGFLNLFVNFMPTMLEHGGRIVTFRTSQSAARAFVETQTELNDLAQIVSMNSRTSSASPLNVWNNISLSMVFYNEEIANSHKISSNLKLNVNEIAERIIKGILAEQRLIQVKVDRNYVEYYLREILHYFKLTLRKLLNRQAAELSPRFTDIKS